jgi:hypothetical protein
MSKDCTTCNNNGAVYDPDSSPTATQVSNYTIEIENDGYLFDVLPYMDTVCIGDGDPHTTVCLDSHQLFLV